MCLPNSLLFLVYLFSLSIWPQMLHVCMCNCGWYVRFRSGCAVTLWAGSWVFLSQAPPSSSGHWTYGAPSSPPQTESDNNGPLERKSRLVIGRCLEEYQDQLSPSVNSQTMWLSIAGVHTHCRSLWNTQLFISYEQRHAVAADKHRKSQFVKHHAIAPFVLLLCVRQVCMQRPLVTNSSIIPSRQYIP